MSNPVMIPDALISLLPTVAMVLCGRPLPSPQEQERVRRAYEAHACAPGVWQHLDRTALSYVSEVCASEVGLPDDSLGLTWEQWKEVHASVSYLASAPEGYSYPWAE